MYHAAVYCDAVCCDAVYCDGLYCDPVCCDSVYCDAVRSGRDRRCDTFRRCCHSLSICNCRVLYRHGQHPPPTQPVSHKAMVLSIVKCLGSASPPTQPAAFGRHLTTFAMTKFTPLTSGDGVAMFTTRRSELAAEQRD